MLSIQEFISQHPNWETLLSSEPYYITTEWDGDYFLLKYSQFESDFLNPLVRECRGSIFYKDPITHAVKCVCMPFYKFGNYGESYADPIDWPTAKVMEKVDGSLIKVWHHNGWHVSTNGKIDAYQRYNDSDFGSIVDKALNGNTKDFFEILDKNRVYMFELVSPYSRVTISYDYTALYYLGSRDMITMQELEYNDYPVDFAKFGIKHPKFYDLSSLEACIEAVNHMSKDEEGFVVVDKEFHRLKVKSPEYLVSFHANNNGVITTRRVLSLIQENKLDDFLGYCPQYTDFVNDIRLKLKLLIQKYNDILYDYWCAFELPRKEFAEAVKKSPYKDFLFRRYDNPNLSAKEYVLSWTLSRLTETIQNDLEV